MALISQVNTSEYGIVQPSSCITDANVINKWGARSPARDQDLKQIKKLYRMNDRMKKRMDENYYRI